MRIKIVQTPTRLSVDGVPLDRFQRGHQYEVGTSLGALLLAEGWAVPVGDEEPGPLMPFNEIDAFARPPYRGPDSPPNLLREHYPPYLEHRPEVAFDFRRRRKPRTKT